MASWFCGELPVTMGQCKRLHRVTGPDSTAWLLPLTGKVGGDVSANNRASVHNYVKPVISISTMHSTGPHAT